MASTAAGAAMTPKAIQTSEYELWFGRMCMCMMSLSSTTVRAIYWPMGGLTGGFEDFREWCAEAGQDGGEFEG